MFLAHLHARGGDDPQGLVQVDFIPAAPRTSCDRVAVRARNSKRARPETFTGLQGGKPAGGSSKDKAG